MEGTPQQPSVPAGWYPDPGGQGLRYWDGAAWTEHTAPAAPAAEQPQQAEVTAPAQAAQAEVTAPAQAAQAGPPPGSTATASGVAAGAPAAPAADAPSTLDWVLSIALPLLPLLGLIWGIYLRSQGGAKETPGNVAILLSLFVVLLVVLFIL
jgi:Protein of unknown function (DUF2510)